MQDPAAAHREDFDSIVEAGGIGSSRLDDGLQQVDVLAPEIRLQFGFAGVHPIPVAAHGVDFAIVRKHAERLRQRPGGEGVRAVALVEKRDRRLVIFARQVGVEFFERRGNKEPFVDDRAVRKRRNVKIRDLVGCGAVLDFVAREEKPALVVVVPHSRGAADQHMLDERHGGLRLFAKDMVVDRNGAPAEHEKLAFFQHLLSDRPRPRRGVFVVGGQEHHAHTEVGRIVKRVPEARNLGGENLVGDLCAYARAVARLGIGVERTAVHQAANRGQRRAQDFVGALAADLRDKSDAAGIVLKIGVV